ncbi:MORN-repeat protein [Orpheovirus IHUMI-LCC2]|uniref:MORN-repeat protein n=1 Tax=Orpheovirus IHUMI-LCC2 TaxID=2023057 RepID=A0A2I2L4M6_9VIRU|nr:MORN-repeat protein [Orpheovirus IHUMI-LCC2]SNW62483.1 MORN-repeat protein [Orpheovirus IHUMI-LCC2]
MNIEDLSDDTLKFHIIFSDFHVYKVCTLINKRFNKLCTNVSYFLEEIKTEKISYYLHRNTGLLEGIYKEYDDNGNVVKVIDKYRNGKATGKVRTYYPNGNIQSESHIINGILYGMCTKWHENGIKKEELMCIGDIQNGCVTNWYENGNLMYQYIPDNNKNTVTIKYYYDNGSLQSILMYKNDKLYSKKKWDTEGNIIKDSFCNFI